MSGGEVSGVDLARVALRAAMEQARKNGGGQKTKQKPPRVVRTVRRDAREPMGLGAAIGSLVTEWAWAIPAAGGSVLGQWPDIAAAVSSRLPDHVQAVAFHPETGHLDLRHDSPAYATQLRLISAQIIATANQTVGTRAVRGVRVLAVGAAPAPRVTEPIPAAATQAPVKTRDMASPGYQQALTAHQAVAPAQRVAPGIAEAVERQTRAMRELSRRAFPDDQPPLPIEAARIQRRRESEATRACAAAGQGRTSSAGPPRGVVTPRRGDEDGVVRHRLRRLRLVATPRRGNEDPPS
ncbi:DciA family protein [Streptomyces sp. NPDC020898]|uniref:DciA family protein n=1 Tax=Streptomyces sp. NPDC020898 TaxID=3365101 RepID=UPI0037942B6B